jgi:hypothetical protein
MNNSMMQITPAPNAIKPIRNALAIKKVALPSIKNNL